MTAAVVAASLAIHGLVVVVIELREPRRPGPAERLQTAAAEGEAGDAVAGEAPAAPNCLANAALAAWGGAAVCASPFGGPDCWAELDQGHRAWVDECHELIVWEQDEEEKLQREREPVRIAFLDDSQLARLEPLEIAPLLEPQQKQAEQQKQEEIAEKAEQIEKQQRLRAQNQQVVEITQPDVMKSPENARFVSEYDSAVDKEKVARGSTEEMIRRPGPKELPIAERQKLPEEIPPQELAKKQPKSDFENPEGTGKLDMRKPGEPEELAPRRRQPKEIGADEGSEDPLAKNGFARKKGERPLRFRRRERSELPRGEGGEEGARGRPKAPDLRPSEELLSRVAGGGSVDKLDGVESGDETALNSKRWKFASFFNRMKRQVAQNWHPNQVYLQRDPNGNVYGFKNRTTVVSVMLRKDGSLVGVHILKPSGVDFLDEEAVQAFRRAQPFPNPPGGLIDRQSKTITFRFGFHFEIGGSRSRWKIFRYR